MSQRGTKWDKNSTEITQEGLSRFGDLALIYARETISGFSYLEESV
jgi:hypothetical protein